MQRGKARLSMASVLGILQGSNSRLYLMPARALRYGVTQRESFSKD